MSREVHEYPDAAGYPDGRGFLDQGTTTREPEPADLGLPSADADDELTVIDDIAGHAYRAVIAGRTVASLHYAAAAGGEFALRATVVAPDLRGRGLATALIAHVLDLFSGAGVMVVVECSEVRRFIDLHPQYARMVVTPTGEGEEA